MKRLLQTKVFSIRRVSLLLSLIALLFTSCNNGDINEMPVISTNTGKEMFSGIFFLSGPVYEKLPALRDKYDMNTILQSQDSKATYSAYQDLLISKMEESGYSFDKFKHFILSKDPIKIENALLSGTQSLMESIYEISKEDLVYKAINTPYLLEEAFRNNPESQKPEIIFNKLNKGEINLDELYSKFMNYESFRSLSTLASPESARTQGIACVNLALAANVVVVGAVAVLLFIEVYVAVDAEVCLWEGFLSEYGRVASTETVNGLEQQLLIKSIIETL